MSIVGFFTARFSNSKGNPFNLGKKDKINSLKINIIMNNIVKAKRDDNLNFLNNKGDPKYGNKRGRKPYNKKNNNKNRKIQISKLNKYYKKKRSLNFSFFDY